MNDFADPIQPTIPRWAWGLFTGLVVLAFGLFYFKNAILAAGVIAGIVGVAASFHVRIRMYMLAGLIPFAHAGFGVGGFGGLGVYDLFALWFVLLFLFTVFARELFSFKAALLPSLTAVMFFSYVPSVLNAADMMWVSRSFVQLGLSMLLTGGVYYLLRTHFDRKEIVQLLQFVVVEAASVSLYGIYQNRSSSLAGLAGQRVYFDTFGDVNYYAGYLAMMLAIGIGCLLIEKRALYRTALAGSLVALGIGIVSSVSRAGLLVSVGIIVAFAGYLMTLPGKMKVASIIVFTFFFSAAGLLIVTGIGGKFVDMLALADRWQSFASQKDKSVMQRQAILNVAVRMSERHWLIGAGFGNFEQTFDHFKKADISTGFKRSTHNTYLRIIAETGVIGMITTMLALFVLMKRLLSTVLKAADMEGKLIGFGLFLAVASFLIMSITLDQMHEQHFWFIAGVGLAYRMAVTRNESTRQLSVSSE